MTSACHMTCLLLLAAIAACAQDAGAGAAADADARVKVATGGVVSPGQVRFQQPPPAHGDTPAARAPSDGDGEAFGSEATLTSHVHARSVPQAEASLQATLLRAPAGLTKRASYPPELLRAIREKLGYPELQRDQRGRGVPMFVGKRYGGLPMFVGKRQGDLFVGRQADEGYDNDDNNVEESMDSKEARTMDKKYRPMFVGKRQQRLFGGKSREPFLVWRSVGDEETSEKESEEALAKDKRGYRPMFVGKKGVIPMFVGKKSLTPMYVGKRNYRPMFVGKRNYRPMFVGKRHQNTKPIGYKSTIFPYLECADNRAADDKAEVSSDEGTVAVARRQAEELASNGLNGVNDNVSFWSSADALLAPGDARRRRRRRSLEQSGWEGLGDEGEEEVGRRAWAWGDEDLESTEEEEHYKQVAKLVGKRDEQNLERLLSTLHAFEAARQYRRRVQADKRYNPPFFVG